MNWTKTSERLPTKNGWYRATGIKKREVDAYFQDGEFYFLNLMFPMDCDDSVKSSMMRIKNMVAWADIPNGGQMENGLPEPPKEE